MKNLNWKKIKYESWGRAITSQLEELQIITSETRPASETEGQGRGGGRGAVPNQFCVALCLVVLSRVGQ